MNDQGLELDNFCGALLAELRQSNFLLFCIAQALRDPDNIKLPDASESVLDELEKKYSAAIKKEEE